MAQLARAGRAPDYFVPPSNIFTYLFSNPFVKGSPDSAKDPQHHAGHDIDVPTPSQKAAFIDGETGARITFARLHKDAKSLAAGLRGQLNLHPAPYQSGSPRDPILSPVILLHLPNGIPFVVLELAGWAAGLTVTTVNWALKPYELAHVIKESRPAVIFTTPGATGTEVVEEAISIAFGNNSAASISIKQRIYVVDAAIEDYGLNRSHKRIISSSTSPLYQDWKTLLQDEGVQELPLQNFEHGEDEARRRTALILWSSGTSGKSKGVVIPHTYLTYGMKLLWLGNPYFTGNEVFMGLPPFFHILGLSNILCLSIIIGATTICMPKFDPETYLRLIQQYRATYLHIAPPLGIFLAKSPLVSQYDLSSVKSCISGGAPLGEAVIESVYKRLGFWIRMSYGTSEGASICQSSAETWEKAKLALSATGIPYPGVEVRVIATDGTAKILARGERGELVFRSPSLLNCYLNNETATRESFDEEGWFYTGDVGIIDESDNVYIVDRLKEVIKVKGFQVAPAELEALLISLDGIADAGVTAMFSEEEQTEYPKAYIVPSDATIVNALKLAQHKPSAQLIAFVTKVNKAVEEKTTHYKRLKGGVILCEAIPKSNSGKILRKDFGTVNGLYINTYGTPSERQSKL